jgi:hypothetical protein
MLHNFDEVLNFKQLFLKLNHCICNLVGTSPHSLCNELKGTQVVNTGVEAPITDHLRDSPLDLEKYKVLQNFLV